MQVGEACRALTTPASWLWLSYLATNPGHDASSRKDRTCNITVPVKDQPHSKRTGEGLGGVEAKRTGGREICVSCCSFDPTGKQIIQEEGAREGGGEEGGSDRFVRLDRRQGFVVGCKTKVCSDGSCKLFLPVVKGRTSLLFILGHSVSMTFLFFCVCVCVCVFTLCACVPVQSLLQCSAVQGLVLCSFPCPFFLLSSSPSSTTLTLHQAFTSISVTRQQKRRGGA